MNEEMHLNVQRLLICWKKCPSGGAAKRGIKAREVKAVVLDKNLKSTDWGSWPNALGTAYFAVFDGYCYFDELAEAVRFELTEGVNPRRFSRPVP